MFGRPRSYRTIDAAEANILSESVAPLPFDKIDEFNARNERAGLTISRRQDVSRPWIYDLDGVGRIYFRTDDIWEKDGRRTILVSLETYYCECLLLYGGSGAGHAEMLSTLKSLLRRSHALCAADRTDIDPSYDDQIPVIFVDDVGHRA